MIYLISNTKSDDKEVINFALSEIKFEKFSLDLSKFDALIISSKNAIKALQINQISLFQTQIYVLGKASLQSAKNFGFEKIKISSKAYGNDLANEFKDELKGKKVLYLRAKQIASSLPEILLENGVNLTQIIAYESVEISNLINPPKAGSVLIFTSPKNVQIFKKIFSLDTYKLVAIGESTAKALGEQKKVFIPQICDIDACIKLAKTIL
ncbi:MAG: uroporphyrinogen-III synthase [Campylobacter sp.]|nr:uroporphyrinogen-III synthase [Campylobacter sp.]